MFGNQERTLKKMNEKLNKKHILYMILFTVGIFLRFFVMSLGNNFDFESYCIVGEISGNFRNVYAETTRYNYAPLFFCIQGFLYRLSQIRPESWEIVYRVLIVSVLTLTDLVIAIFIGSRYSLKHSIIFFLNPVSIIITGYHNQFDNIAVLFALISTIYFNKDENINKNDFYFVLFMSLSLITKHLMFIIPIFILLMKTISIKKRFLYSFVPPLIFGISFLPFAMSSDAMNGIINNVFLYRSFNNMPLLRLLFDAISFPSNLKIFVYIFFMVLLAWYVRYMDFKDILVAYLVAMVAFSSAIANQYLAIPLAALCLMSVWYWDKIYMFIVGAFLILESNGLNELERLQKNTPESFASKTAEFIVNYGYMIASWILFIALMHYLFKNLKKRKLMN